MNFRGHLIGGTTAGIVVAGVAVATGQARLSLDALVQGLQSPFSPTGDGLLAVNLLLIAITMSLFPDLDSASVPQRWFYRVIFLILAGLLIVGRMDLFAVLAFISLAPLLHRHRGWTHSRITPFVIALLVALIIEYSKSRTTLFYDFSFRRMALSIKDNWLYLLACVAGHYTHLLLDSQ